MDEDVFNWTLAARSLARPYHVPASMVVLLALVPFYILIPAYWPLSVRHAPELAFDRALPLVPAWVIVYGVLYLFLILLPLVVVRQADLIRRMFNAYLLIWLTAYVCFFVLYPTDAPRRGPLEDTGFAVWGLRVLYAADPPYNCFPSLHVAHSVVSALACSRVHRQVGGIALALAVLVALATLLTKQHYVVDVIAGGLLAVVAYAVFLRRVPSRLIPDIDRLAAPALAVCVAAVAGVGVVGSWLAYLWNR